MMGTKPPACRFWVCS